MGTQGKVITEQGINIVNLKGKILMPGLMDMHVYLNSDAEDNFLAAKGNSVPHHTVRQ